MDKQKIIYCDLGFWQYLSEKLTVAKPSPDPEDCKRVGSLIDWYGLMQRSIVYFNCSVKTFDTATNDDLYLKHVWKCSTDGRCKLEFDEFGITKMTAGPSQMDSKMYNALFLTKEDYKKEALKLGVINVCSKELFEHIELFGDQGTAIQKDDRTDWNSLLERAHASHNCNAMMIVDNYVFEDTKHNLYEILNALLPQSLDVFFYLTIFFYNNGPDKNIDDNKKAVEETIKEIRPNLSVKVEVFGIKKNDFHDRAIITNYMWVGAGSGFDLISQRKADKSTELHVIYPMITPDERVKWSTDRYHILIDDAKKSLRIRGKNSSNRLLR